MTDDGPNATRIAVDADAGVLRVELDGRYELRDWLDVIEAAGRTDGYEPGMDALYDATRAHFDFTSEDVQVLEEWVRQRIDRWGSGWRYAVVVSTDVMFRLCETIGSLWGDPPFETGVFRSVEAAESWLAEERGG